MDGLAKQTDVLRLVCLDADRGISSAGPEADFGQHDNSVHRLDREIDHVGTVWQLATRNEEDRACLRQRERMIMDGHTRKW